MRGAHIIATGYWQPERILTNDDLTRLVDTSDEWIRSRVGVRERRIADADTSVTTMATGAGRRALDRALHRASVDAQDVDLVVVASCTAHDRSPNIAAQVAAGLDLVGPATLDVNVACSGYTHALAVAHHAIAAGSAEHALVIGVEKLSDFTDWTDRTTCVLVGDGAGAMVMSASRGQGVGPVRWGSAPELASAVRILGKDGTFEQDGQTVFRWTTTQLESIARDICERSGIKPTDLVGVVLHQANLRIINPVVTRLGLGEDVVVARDVEVSGNTSAASIPTAFAKLDHAGRFRSGGPVLLLGFGGGLSYAGLIVSAP